MHTVRLPTVHVSVSTTRCQYHLGVDPQVNKFEQVSSDVHSSDVWGGVPYLSHVMYLPLSRDQTDSRKNITFMQLRLPAVKTVVCVSRFRFRYRCSRTNGTKNEHFSFLTSFWYLQIEQGGKVSYFIDAQDKTVSNWMRYVNCARYGEEQNVQAFQYRKKIYYRTTKEIDRDEELLVYYGDKYAKDLGECFL